MSERPSTWSILYIEDDEALARLVQKALVRSGIQIEIAATAAAGLQRLKDRPFDAVALDHYLPDSRDLEILLAIRRDHPAMPVVYVTANEDVRTAIKALKAGAADYVVKTIEPEFLEFLSTALLGAIDHANLVKEKEETDRALRESHDHIRDLAEQREILLREINHRVANSLQLLLSILHMQSSLSPEPAIKTALADVSHRLSAISSLHQRLYTSDDVRSVSMMDYLERLLEELQSMVRNDDIRVSLDGDQVEVATDKAVKLGIVVNELVTNALKYAFPVGSRGNVRIGLRKGDDDWICLDIEDDGVGYSLASHGTGLGQRIVTAMVNGLGGRLERIDVPKGTRFRILFTAV
ncbi:MAG: response regulator [Dongiaceae bacterium]